MTVEASVIVPVILIIAISLIMMFLYLYEREYLRSEIYVKAYSVPYHSSKSDADILYEQIERYMESSGYVFNEAMIMRLDEERLIYELELYPGDVKLNVQVQ